MRFQKKGGKDNCSSDYGDCYIEADMDAHQHYTQQLQENVAKEQETTEQKHR